MISARPLEEPHAASVVVASAAAAQAASPLPRARVIAPPFVDRQ
jgi:hypothetical protein